MKHTLLVLLCLPLCAVAQTEKGARPAIPDSTTPAPQSTRAVIIGISDYQSPQIPRLQYAHRDALAFAGWLRSARGLDDDHLRLLTNQDAKLSQFAAAIDWLIDESREGDLAILYFSGHADVERKALSQPGFLLCYDAPPQVYYGGGALQLGILQDLVSALSVEKKVRVLIITDACHAGKLAGSEIGGSQLTNANLARQFGKEIKILSCQPEQYALEGPQWGGGRGAFSYHLVEGLYGLADQDHDQAVTLLEIGRYLEDKVAAEADGQLPMTVGNKAERVTGVDAALLAKLQESKKGQSPTLSPTAMRGLEDEVLAGVDSSVRADYLAFKAAVANGELLSAAAPGRPANDLYEQLLREPGLAPLHKHMRRNLAAALQDEPQQALNALLENDPYEGNNWQYHPEKYAQYPAYLQRAIELLGEQHYMFRSLMSKKRYFEGYNIAKTLAAQEQEPVRRDSLREAAKQLYLEGIRYDPDAAYLYFAVGDMYFSSSPYQTDSLVLWCNRAVERSPGWVTPVLRIFQEYVHNQADLETGERYLDRVLQILPDSYNALEKLGFLRLLQCKRDETIAVAQKMISQKPDLFNAYTILEMAYFFFDGDYPLVEEFAQKSMERNPSPNNWALNFWASCYAYLHPGPGAVEWILRSLEGSTGYERGHRAASLVQALGFIGRYAEAEQYARQFMAENLPPPTQAILLHMLGDVYMAQGRLAEAAGCFQRSLSADPTANPIFMVDSARLGEIAYLEHRNADAEQLFKKALAYGGGFGEKNDVREQTVYRYGRFLLQQDRLKEAAGIFQQALDERRKGFWGEYGFALLAARKGKQQEALDWLQRALDNYWPDARDIRQEPLFAKIRKTKRFRALMAKYFPEGSN